MIVPARGVVFSARGVITEVGQSEADRVQRELDHALVESALDAAWCDYDAGMPDWIKLAAGPAESPASRRRRRFVADRNIAAHSAARAQVDCDGELRATMEVSYCAYAAQAKEYAVTRALLLTDASKVASIALQQMVTFAKAVVPAGYAEWRAARDEACRVHAESAAEAESIRGRLLMGESVDVSTIARFAAFKQVEPPPGYAEWTCGNSAWTPSWLDGTIGWRRGESPGGMM